MESDASCIDAEVKRLSARSKAKKNAVERLKTYIMTALERTDTKKLDTGRYSVTVKQNPEALDCSDSKALLEWCKVSGNEQFLRQKEPELDAAEVKKAIQLGIDIPFCSLKRGKSIMIK